MAFFRDFLNWLFFKKHRLKNLMELEMLNLHSGVAVLLCNYHDSNAFGFRDVAFTTWLYGPASLTSKFACSNPHLRCGVCSETETPAK